MNDNGITKLIRVMYIVGMITCLLIGNYDLAQINVLMLIVNYLQEIVRNMRTKGEPRNHPRTPQAGN